MMMSIIRHLHKTALAALILLVSAHLPAFAATGAAAESSEWQCPESLQQTLPTLEAGKLQLCDTVKSAKAVMIVNTASMCGFTPQFEGLEALYQEYKDQGLLILGVPTGDFNDQEYEDSAKTAKVCHANYGVTFPVFRKGCIRCDDPQPLLALGQEASDTRAKWNFYKFLLNTKTGEAEAFSSMTKPESKKIKKAIEKILAQ
ncbi:glutathione peroxidase [Spongiibacter sp. KMU-158]|uniref:Glutathione peroxidase n=1 Tax=Spongiibacter pelagi TaxID=2760804 RepID=A0A927C1B7_9GAMM|nr:glutathione peroxidase [Spongiibacter pelagi]MBD2858924.1 glutathione peroxidase [Spongiibacter pelagi]